MIRRIVEVARINLGRMFLHIGWKLIGVHISPGTITTPDGKDHAMKSEMIPEEPCAPFLSPTITINDDGTYSDTENIILCRCMPVGLELPWGHNKRDGMSATGKRATTKYFRDLWRDLCAIFAPDPRNQNLSAENVHVKPRRLLSGYAFELRSPGGSMCVTEREARQLRRMLGALFPDDVPAAEESR